MNVEVLSFEGCPNHEPLLEQLQQLMLQSGIQSPVTLTVIESDAGARAAGFLGSPTLRIDGEDVEPGADRRTDFGRKCRLYVTPEGLRGRIPDELIAAALARHAARR